MGLFSKRGERRQEEDALFALSRLAKDIERRMIPGEDMAFGSAWMCAWNDLNGYGWRVEGATEIDVQTARMQRGAATKGPAYELHYERWRKSGLEPEQYLARNWSTIVADCDGTSRCPHCGTSHNMHLPECPEATRKVSSTHFSTGISPHIAEILEDEDEDDPIDLSRDTASIVAGLIKETESRRTDDSRDYCDGKLQALGICRKTIEHYGETDDALPLLAGLYEDSLQWAAAFPSLTPNGLRFGGISEAFMQVSRHLAARLRARRAA